MKLVFFGTSDYCLPVLEALYKNFDLKSVVTRPDKPVGRKKIPTPSTTKVWAEKHHVPVVTPVSLKAQTQDRIGLIGQISHIRPDLALVADYGLIIPEAIFNLPKYRTLNIHFSRLPDLRGPSPVQFTLLRGDDTAWITIFKLENPPELPIKMDSGPILWQKSYPIYPDDTTQILYTRLFQEAAKILPKVIAKYEILNTKYSFVPQDHSRATFTRFLTKDDGFIPWKILLKAQNNQPITINTLPKIQQEALKTKQDMYVTKCGRMLQPTSNYKTIYDFYRAVTPWPGMFTFVPKTKNQQSATRRMLIRKCHLADDRIALDEIQYEGGVPMAQ